eukprot:TRINITY_DN1638_c0_g1_i14.p1 TRINITY_DN1638_c0_g1~~TRINITY_DN1638_c0_g1_i14.p1  ORF type:complete len:428 (+),score=108.71 TRINITY_DN1638_c0_g1_i14:153-1286(+)
MQELNTGHKSTVTPKLTTTPPKPEPEQPAMPPPVLLKTEPPPPAVPQPPPPATSHVKLEVLDTLKNIVQQLQQRKPEDHQVETMEAAAVSGPVSAKKPRPLTSYKLSHTDLETEDASQIPVTVTPAHSTSSQNDEETATATTTVVQYDDVTEKHKKEALLERLAAKDKILFVFTDEAKYVLDTMKREIQHLKGEVVPKWKRNCVVIAKMPTTSRSFLCGCASGAWILKPDYIQCSIQQGHFLEDKERFELTSADKPTHSQAGVPEWDMPRQCRKHVEQSGSGMFHGLNVVVVMQLNVPYWVNIFKAGGAEVTLLSVPVDPNNALVAGAKYVVVDKCTEADSSVKALIRHSVLVVRKDIAIALMKCSPTAEQDNRVHL